MTTPSSFQSLGLSITVEDPLVKTNRSTFERLSEQINTYTHETRAIGGYWSNRFTVNDSQTKIEDWIQDGIARHIVVHNPYLNVIWEGFVNKLTVRLGPFTFILGPLVDIGNRIATVYSQLDNTLEPAVKGIRKFTSDAEDTDSQDRYGIIEKILSIGGSSDSNAEQIRDTWIAEHASPETSRQSNLSGEGGPSVQVECLGYWHWFKLYTYSFGLLLTGTHTGANNASVLTDAAADFVNDGVVIGMLIENLTDDSEGTITAVTANTVTATLTGGTDDDWDTNDEYRITSQQTLSSKIENVVTSDPNGFFSTDYSRITENAIIVGATEKDRRTAQTILKELNTWGDTSFNRYNIGVYKDRQVVYEVSPSEIKYQQRITGNEGIVDNLGSWVKPWDVQPAQWLFYPDFLVGRLPPVTADTLKTDPRTGFIESVKYTAPWGLSINGVKVGQMDQVLAHLGLLGVGV